MYKTKLLNRLDIYVRKKFTPYIIIPLTAAMAYCNSFNVPFLLDDFSSITNNYSIHHLFQLSDLWHFYANRIVLYFSMSLNYVVLGNYLESYHIVNLLIHIFNGLLFYKLLEKLFGLPYFNNKLVAKHPCLVSLIAAVLFICHPIQVNAVTYIIQRTASLAALFYLLSVNFYLGYRITGRTNKLIGVILCTIAAMFTKENTITIPFMLLLLEIMFFSDNKIFGRQKKFFSFLLIFSTVPIIPITNILLQGHSLSDPDITFKASTSMGRLQYFYTQLNVLLHYIRLLIIPVGQNFDYSNDYPISHSLWDNYSYISLFVLVMILSLSVLTYKRNRLVSLGILWFFISIAVESSFISIKDVYFEHRVYLPAAGFIMFLTGLITYEKKVDKCVVTPLIKGKAYSITEEYHTGLIKQPIYLYLYITLVLIPLYTGLTLHRNYIYSDSIRLWSDTVKKAPNSDRAHNSLATAYLNTYEENKNSEDLETAEKEFKIALKINNSNSFAHCNLSKVYLLRGLYEDSIIEAKLALKLSKSDYSYFHLGSAYIKSGRTDEALSALLKGYEINHRSTLILKALGDTYRELGDMENADKYYEEYKHHTGILSISPS